MEVKATYHKGIVIFEELCFPFFFPAQWLWLWSETSLFISQWLHFLAPHALFWTAMLCLRPCPPYPVGLRAGASVLLLCYRGGVCWRSPHRPRVAAPWLGPGFHPPYMFLQSWAPSSHDAGSSTALLPKAQTQLLVSATWFPQPWRQLGVVESQAALGDFFLWHPTVGPCLSSAGSCSKVPRAWWLKPQRFISSQFWWSEVQCQAVSRTRLCLPDDKTEWPAPGCSPGCWWLRALLACWWPSFPSVFPCGSICVSLSASKFLLLISRWLSGKESACQCRRPKRRGFDLCIGKDPLQKEMAGHSSIPVWKIPWTEESGRPQSMGSQRVGHDWAHTRIG